jgi:hypothetical protein
MVAQVIDARDLFEQQAELVKTVRHIDNQIEDAKNKGHYFVAGELSCIKMILTEDE